MIHTPPLTIGLNVQKLYSSLKFFNYPDHITAIKNRQTCAPVHVRIKPINHCNHDCWYCAYRVSNLQLGENMQLNNFIPEDKMMEVVDDLISMGTKAVTFSGGGEPLLYKPLVKTISRLGKADIKIGCLSNGSNLKGKVADAFAKYGNWIRISLDAWDDESYTCSRGAKPGEFTKLISNIKSFQARQSNCTLGISLIIGHDNASHIMEICSLFKNLNVDHIKISAAVVSNNNDENNAYHDTIKERVRQEIDEAKTLQNDSFSILDHYHDLPSRFEKSYSFCPYLSLLTVIGADQKVYTCQDKAYTDKGLIGSLENTSFKNFWFAEETRKKLFELDPRESCKHHCVTQSKNETLYEFLTLDSDHAHFV